MASLFFSYSHKDENLRDQLEIHLSSLKREGAIDVWHDRRIPAGNELDHEISQALERADVVLLLISPDFLASAYCNDVEMSRAMERHGEGTARVIPVILRPCDWKRTAFGKLAATPRDGRPITKWPDRDEAFLDVVMAIRTALGEIARPQQKSVQALNQIKTKPADQRRTAHLRSSNLRVRKEFTDADQDKFLDESFEFIARFFENSLLELQERNRDIQTTFKRISSEQFSAIAYRHGKAAARCSIRLGGRRSFMGGITFSYNDDAVTNSFNEALSVEIGEQELFLRAGMVRFSGGKGEHLSQEGAAEHFWAMFIEPLQR